ncbi:hypothetical protein SAMN06269185_2983 [Natronoarchaeum philippinense]|uniref:Uncharacterized protein n=1 Tax=Natronoarchaeum philippinense TaxID=558529 RepID=A0A285PBT5_NATPI|nr:hypothetical protein [Natronoarchaeum philippinense]SNZ17321.1 hypothetical protein SAMN06269185_2983 [Natronoarchaeum philippinense]
MSSVRATVFVALVVLGTVLAVPFAGAFALTDAADAQSGGANTTNATDGNTSEGPGFGVQLSAFMQTSSANATSAVESGMFEAEYETATNQTAVVDKRADRIERKIAQLRDRKQRLTDRSGQMSDVAYTVQMSQLASQIEALERQINETASKPGAEAARFDRLRTNVSAIRGPSVAAAADVIPGRGPPADRGPGDRGPPTEQGTNGGPPTERGGDNTGETDSGTPENAANGSTGGVSPGDRGDQPGNDRGRSAGTGEGRPGDSEGAGGPNVDAPGNRGTGGASTGDDEPASTDA